MSCCVVGHGFSRGYAGILISSPARFNGFARPGFSLIRIPHARFQSLVPLPDPWLKPTGRSPLKRAGDKNGASLATAEAVAYHTTRTHHQERGTPRSLISMPFGPVPVEQ